MARAGRKQFAPLAGLWSLPTAAINVRQTNASDSLQPNSLTRTNPPAAARCLGRQPRQPRARPPALIDAGRIKAVGGLRIRGACFRNRYDKRFAAAAIPIDRQRSRTGTRLGPVRPDFRGPRRHDRSPNRAANSGLVEFSLSKARARRAGSQPLCHRRRVSSSGCSLTQAWRISTNCSWRRSGGHRPRTSRPAATRGETG